jgi:predicted CxxxxCH...CXXCH cytochrome family protein
MTVPIRSFRDLRQSTLSLMLLVAFAGIAGCANDHSPGGMISPPDWVVLPSGGRHATSATLTYIANDGSSSCIECHGADLSGGTSNVSCFDNPAGCHHGPVAQGWVVPRLEVQNHGVVAKKAPGSSGFASCQICHGSDFSGGGAGRACAECHGVAAPHPSGWRLGDAYVHNSTDPENAPVCALCHFGKPPFGNHPPAAPPAGSDPGCFNNTLCHGPVEVSHSVPFPGAPHTTTDPTSFDADCSACHAITGVSPGPAAPLCTVCHQAGSPLTSLDCTSCHGNPPSGAAYPDVAGKHAVHGALPGVETCTPCHSGLVAGTLEHYHRANARPGSDALRVPPGDVAFEGYNAQSGAASFDASSRTCSNVICHGGQVTPDWQTAATDAIDVPNACLSCHVSGTTQHNSYFSGRHEDHIEKFGLSAATCKRCHDEAKVNVTGHFDNLATTAFEQPASATILSAVRYNGNSCNPRAGGLTGCHGNERW